MRKTNNVKALIWDIFAHSDYPITVTEIARRLDDVPTHSVYSAIDSLKSDKVIVEIPSRAGKTYKRGDLPDQKSRALQILLNNDGQGFRRAEIAEMIGCHPHRAYVILEQLVAEGWINRIGGNRLVYYYSGNTLKYANNLTFCKACEKETLHKRGSTGRIMCTVCGKQKKRVL